MFIDVTLYQRSEQNPRVEYKGISQLMNRIRSEHVAVSIKHEMGCDINPLARRVGLK